MEQIIIQYGEKQNHIPELLRSEGEEIHIGRSFNNTLVINDDYIAPQQLRIFKRPDAEGNSTWWADILDQTNSVLLNGKTLVAKNKPSPVQITSGDTLTIGRTTLAIFAPEHPVEKTRKLLTRRLHQDSIGFLLPLILLLLFSAIDIGLEHLLTVPQESLSSFLTTSFLSAGVVLIWTSIWAFIGRVFRHRGHFFQQLIATTLIFFILSLLVHWPSIIGFSASSSLVETLLNYTVAFIIIALLLKFNLFFATNLKKTSLLGPLFSLMILIGVGGYDVYERKGFSAQADYSRGVKPHFMHFGSDNSVEEYSGKLHTAFDKLEAQTAQKNSQEI